ncbi:hypothetical protein LTR84_003398 [Exophiala bonariae]|uniref:Ketosynthase family 3 (KS3) domain-containing protein n=1 Tax=Exophiala bonariae TaxID=1690606 RepID=A0AAV9N761_9EURO|nr:hypothetical protein LTR84_003398 [Exophiala bonariae]
MHPETQHTLAYTLLIELLAYQFASPVRWIETQAHILENAQIERVIEIGPSNTLTSMIKKTHASSQAIRDVARGMRREFLCVSNDEAQIYYQDLKYDHSPTNAQSIEEAETMLLADKSTLQSTPSDGVSAVPKSLLDIRLAGSSGKRLVENHDTHPTALEVIRTILSTKLKKLPAGIASSSSIKQLAAGRSSLENEIVGDFLDEFKSVPERPEELSLQALADDIQLTFDGTLGKKTTLSIERMFSTMMPPGYSPSTAREHLSSQWGLGVGRQNSVLLLTLSMPPSTRLSTTQDADVFLDNVLSSYAKAAKLTFSGTTDRSNGEQHMTMVNPQLLSRLMKGQSEVIMDVLRVLAQHTDNLDLASSDKALASLRDQAASIQGELDIWVQEHGEVYSLGIRPLFSAVKVREYDSTWNWVMQNLYLVLNSMIDKNFTCSRLELERLFHPVLRRSTDRVLLSIKYILSEHFRQCNDEAARSRIRVIAHTLLALCAKSLKECPRFIDSGPPPHPCKPAKMMNNGVQGVQGVSSINMYTPADIIAAYSRLPVDRSTSKPHIKRRIKSKWIKCKDSTSLLNDAMFCLRHSGLSFSGRYVLLVGAGRKSIGADVLKGLLGGGACVLVTTSNFSTETAAYYQQIFCDFGARGSRLIVAPFNQGSKGDVASLVRYIFSEPSEQGLGWDLDHVIPLAAISEAGREIDLIDSTAELAHRLMLINLLRLLGEIKIWKSATRKFNRPTQVLVPLSPNHGTFGHDGLYGESKLSLETLFNRWYSESWSGYVSITGTVIGWTKGTRLMHSNDELAPLIETLAGIRTFSTREMSLHMLALMSTPLVSLSQEEPILADFSGGLSQVLDFRSIFERAQRVLQNQNEMHRLLQLEILADHASKGVGSPQMTATITTNPRPAPRLEFPRLPSHTVELEPLSHLRGMLDLDRVVVVTGFAEIGPYGNSRTRWDMEALGDFSAASYIEIAQMMGLIRFESDVRGKNDVRQAAWVDNKTGLPIDDGDVAARYVDVIHAHCGIRPIEPDLMDGYDPKDKTFFHEVALERDLAPFKISQSLATQYLRKHGDKVQLKTINNSENVLVTFKKGAIIHIPKAIDFNRDVAGQIPSGWSAATYGVSEEIINQVDRGTLYTLVCVSEALIASGIIDPYEFYEHIHVSELGNCIGSGLGGIDALRNIYRDRFIDKSMPNDVLQETFANTTAAWINMLLFSSSGPIKTPVGACATALESLDAGYDLIVSGKAQVCVVGGHDGFSEEVSYEFGMMSATLDTVRDAAHGRSPKEMSRPATSSRDGFVESYGAGAQIITSASLALRMGLPIYGVVAMTGTASDKVGRSVPAPGKGLAVLARESLRDVPSPMLDITFRRQRLQNRLEQIDHFRNDSLIELLDHHHGTESLKVYKATNTISKETKVLGVDEELPEGWDCCHPTRTAYIEQVDMEYRRMQKEARYTLGGNTFYHNDPRISPLRGALAVWNLTVDDLDFASFHGTSTKLNEKNESAVLQSQLNHLGRSQGNPIWGVFQKYLTGHSKGAAGAWMLNGAIQAMNDGVIPGNRNADNIDSTLEQFDHIVYPNRNIPKDSIKAFTVSSFGFGQKGAQAVVVHPRYLYATIDREDYDAYVQLRSKRDKKAQRRFQEDLINNTVVRVKDSPPYRPEDEIATLLDADSRFRCES